MWPARPSSALAIAPLAPLPTIDPRDATPNAPRVRSSSVSVMLAAAGLVGLVGCATVPRRAEVTSLASRMLTCPEPAIRVHVAAIDELCADRTRTPDGQLGPCLSWTPLGQPVGRGWIVEGCGHVDRFAAACEELGPPMPAEIALGGALDCFTY